MNARPVVYLLSLFLAATTSLQAQDRPLPPVVAPPQAGQAPGDAVVLFDGSHARQFTNTLGEESSWTVKDGMMIAGKGDVVSKHTFTDAQIHLEFKLPESGQGHGNSGIYIHGLYEIQIIDSYNPNPYKPGQQCAGIYMTYPPLVNVCRAPGEWQTYDIIFHVAKKDAQGKLIQPERITLFHNATLVQFNCPLLRPTAGTKVRPVDGKGPLLLQSHGSPVAFRNIWIRDIPPVNTFTASPVKGADLGAFAVKVAPGSSGTQKTPGAKPGDAIYLFDGRDVAGWMPTKSGDGKFPWKLENEYMEVVKQTGGIVTRESFTDIQLHVEWATPSEVSGKGQGRGNSGVFLQRKYEVQVLDSYENTTYPDGQASAIYKQYPPLVNASLPPGQWQTYDIVFRAPRYGANGEKLDPGSFIVLHNGILVQDHVVNKKAPQRGAANQTPTGPLFLQDHKNPVRYRNIWYRNLLS